MKVKVINKSHNPLPTYSKEGDACVDLRASFEESIPDTKRGAYFDSEDNCLMLYPNSRALIGTGLHTSFEDGYVLKIMERSGLGSKGIKVNGGNVDSGYNGEIKVSLINLSEELFIVKEGDRIAQAALIPVPKIEWEEVVELDKTERGDNGFNSTGVK